MNTADVLLTTLGLTVVTLVTRCFFLFSERELTLPGWVQRGLRYAPLAAIAAVVAPEVLMDQGQLIDTWRDARLFALAAACACYVWRRSILATIVVGMAVLLPLRIGLGW